MSRKARILQRAKHYMYLSQIAYACARQCHAHGAHMDAIHWQSEGAEAYARSQNMLAMSNNY